MSTPRKHKGQVKTHAPRYSARFAAVPLELREEIYSCLVQDSPATLRSLLQVNRRMAQEVKPFLYRRPPSFDGQCELFRWLETADHDCLKYVVDVRLKLVDINPSNIVGALGKRLRESQVSRRDLRPEDDPKGNPYYEACFEDLKQVQRALAKLPAVKKLTILEYTPSDPTPPEQMNEMFSKMLGHCLPDLRTLCCTKALFPVNFICNKPRLQRLSFTANTLSKDEDVIAVFKKLPDLRLELRRIEKPATDDFDWGCVNEILSNVPPLHSLSIIEEVYHQETTLMEEVFVEYFEAMKRHLRSLRRFILMPELATDSEMVSTGKKNMFRFFEASSLQHVEVRNSYSAVYRHLPGTVQTFILRLDRECCESGASPAPFSDVMQEFMGHVKFRAVEAKKDQKIPRLANLKEIQIWIHGHSHILEPDDEEENPKLLAEKIKMQLRKIGIYFRLIIRSPEQHFADGMEDRL